MNNQMLWYAIIAVLLVSFASLIGVFTLGIKTEKLQKILIYLVAFSAGALLGDVFFHLLPEMIEENEHGNWHLI